MYDKEMELLAYACELFEKKAYDKALETFVLAYEQGLEPEWILENVYNCYMAGNDASFRDAYACQAAGEIVPFEDCLLDFIPYRDGEYYIFDKEERVFLGIFSVPALQEAEPAPVFRVTEFSAAALALDWDFREEVSILTTACERKIYMVCHDAKRCLSFWKIPELREYLQNIKVFLSYEKLQAYFHENTSVYLPMIIGGDQEAERELSRIRSEEHAYRLTPQGRNTENVLLTIAIPTAHRGNLLLERLEHLLKMPYDAEIEIVVSKNGTKLYEEEYKKAGEIQDARLHYYDHRKLFDNYYHNWHYAVEMSCGKYVMPISDEDFVVIAALEHYLKLLSSNPDLCLVRPRSTDNYQNITEREYGKKGWEAFEVMFLTNNYFPGMIIRRKDFIEANLLELDKYKDNPYYAYYPHEWWYLMLCLQGDCMKEPVTLSDDSHPADLKNEWKGLGLSDDFVPGYKNYESRIEQFQGQVEFLQSVIPINDKEILEKFFNMAIGKTVLLFALLRKEYHDSNLFRSMIEKFSEVCSKSIDESCLNATQKERQLESLGGYCSAGYNFDKELIANGQ